jgi:uncharacterized iron-regulated membrane protein
MRQALVLLHRWLGLFTAVFLFIAGLTGAVISWDHELDEWLNPQLFDSATPGERLSPLELANRLESADPRLRISFMPLHHEAGHALTVFIDRMVDPATGKLFDTGFNQLALDPVTGAVQATREWGAISLSRENLLPFLYKLHYSLHIPDGFSLELGVLFMGIVAIVWVIDSGIALWIAFPRRSSWRKSFAFRWHKGRHVITFDLHRSGGVWLWLLLLTLAFTSVSMNLEQQVTRPLVALVSDLTPSPFTSRTPNPTEQPILPRISREEAVRLAHATAQQRGWTAPPGALFYSVEFGLYGVGFHEPGDDHGTGLGHPWLYLDGQDGRLLGEYVPGEGSAGDIFLQAQFPLHSGRIIGLPGRILVSLLGFAVAMFSATGVLIWLRKRRRSVGYA